MRPKGALINQGPVFLVVGDPSMNVPRATQTHRDLYIVAHSSFIEGLHTTKNTASWACIIKRITAIIYGFRNKLECLSLASLSILVQCLVKNTGRNKFYDTGPSDIMCQQVVYYIYNLILSVKCQADQMAQRHNFDLVQLRSSVTNI